MCMVNVGINGLIILILWLCKHVLTSVNLICNDKGHGGIEPLKYDLQSNRTTLYIMSL